MEMWRESISHEIEVAELSTRRLALLNLSPVSTRIDGDKGVVVLQGSRRDIEDTLKILEEE